MRARDEERRISKIATAIQLDDKLRPFYGARRSTVPAQGWLREIRRVTRSPLAQVARAMRTDMKSVFRMERAEVTGTITLKMLQRAAAGMRCDLVYAVVPRKRLR